VRPLPVTTLGDPNPDDGGLQLGPGLGQVDGFHDPCLQDALGGETGLGVLINLARYSYKIPLMFAALLTIALIGVALYSVVLLVERRYAIPAA